MKTIQKLSAVMAVLCLGAVSVQAATFNLNNIASGNWNDQNARTANSYLIGFNAQHPHISAAYFEYNLDPAKGRNVTGANLLIVGSTDYHISTFWPGHAGSPPQHWFKVGTSPQAPGGHNFTVSQITTGNNIANLYHYCCTENQNGDLGYAWVSDGLHAGQRFDAFHYTNSRFQTAVNAGGNYVLWTRDRFDDSNDGQNYIWGSTAFHSGNQLQITTSN